MSRIRVLVVEDDESVQDHYALFFEKAHRDVFAWRLAQTAETARRLLQQKPFELLVLDVRLPGMSGLDFLRWREKDAAARLIPVLVVSGEAETGDRIKGLDVGADDYLVKPFSDEELKSRLLALKRRQDRLFSSHGFYDLGWLKFEPESHEVTMDGAAVHLEPKELDLLVYFLRRPRMVHNSKTLWDMFWDEMNPNFEHVLENKISSLRRKLGRGGVCLQNHKGIGYSLDPSGAVTPA